MMRPGLLRTFPSASKLRIFPSTQAFPPSRIAPRFRVAPFSNQQQQQGQAENPKNVGPISWFSLGLVAITGGFVMWYASKLKAEKDRKYKEATNQVYGKPQLGGPFTLVDHQGRPITDGDLRGKFLLIYFGFTHCPDICPIELQKMSRIVNRLDQSKDKLGGYIQPVFITVDPLRDSVLHVREYIKDFHPRLIGLTGTPAQIEKLCRSYRVYYTKTSEEDKDYLVDHSIILYLMNPLGEFTDFFGTNTSENQAEEKITNHIRQFIESHPDFPRP